MSRRPKELELVHLTIALCFILLYPFIYAGFARTNIYVYYAFFACSCNNNGQMMDKTLDISTNSITYNKLDETP